MPTFIPYSLEEAASRAKAVCASDLPAKTAGIDCEKALPDYMAAVQTGKAAETQAEVNRLSEKIQIVAGIIFCLLYGALAIVATRLFFEWRNSRERGAVLRGRRAAREALLPVQKLKRMSASRSLRNAEDEYRTLESLHEKGLITDEMFEKGKNDLKTALGDNQILQDK